MILSLATHYKRDYMQYKMQCIEANKLEGTGTHQATPGNIGGPLRWNLLHKIYKSA